MLQAAQPLDPPVPYMGDILLLQDGMCAGLFLTPTDHAHAGPTAMALQGGHSGCLPHSAHPPVVAPPPPPPRRPTGAACAARPARWCTRSLRWAPRSWGRPHGLDGNGPLHAAPEVHRWKRGKAVRWVQWFLDPIRI